MTPSHLRDEHEDRGSFFLFSKDSQLTLVKNPIDDSMIFPCVLQRVSWPSTYLSNIIFFVVILPFLIIIIGCLSFSLTHRRLLFEFLLGFFFRWLRFSFSFSLTFVRDSYAVWKLKYIKKYKQQRKENINKKVDFVGISQQSCFGSVSDRSCISLRTLTLSASENIE